jgi:Na+-transporting methylmalonyl-CoA/oxaloacetate decarboxylase gamma subunit
MDSPLVVSLVVTGIGMLMLFLALAFLCGLMYLVTAITRDRPGGEVGEYRSVEGGARGGVGVEEQRAMRRRAAVIGVALARAEQELSTIGAPETGTAVSAWRTLHHQRQLMLNLRGRRGR